jgi:hypothetical protein
MGAASSAQETADLEERARLEIIKIRFEKWLEKTDELQIEEFNTASCPFRRIY